MNELSDQEIKFVDFLRHTDKASLAELLECLVLPKDVLIAFLNAVE